LESSDAGRTPAIHDRLASLERFYGPLPAPPADPFRYFVWEVLGTQTTPGRRDAAYTALQRIPALTPDSLFRASRAQLNAAVSLAGPYQEQRLSALLGGADRFRRQPDLADAIRGPLGAARRAAGTLPRLGDGSIARLLLFGGGHCVMPVDRDTVRLWTRLDTSAAAKTPKASVGRVRHAIMTRLPGRVELFRTVATYLRHHALQTCTDDPHCGVCPLNDCCAWARRPRGSAGNVKRLTGENGLS
jgi:endonuclease III